MAPNDENLIHKLGRKFLLPLFIKLRQTFGGLVLLLLVLLYPILITLAMAIGYLIVLLLSCTFKTFHTIITGQWALSMYSIPTEIAHLHPIRVCSMSYISSVILFLIMGALLAVLIYISYYIHQYIKEHHIKGVV